MVTYRNGDCLRFILGHCHGDKRDKCYEFHLSCFWMLWTVVACCCCWWVMKIQTSLYSSESKSATWFWLSSTKANRNNTASNKNPPPILVMNHFWCWIWTNKESNLITEFQLVNRKWLEWRILGLLKALVVKIYIWNHTTSKWQNQVVFGTYVLWHKSFHFLDIPILADFGKAKAGLWNV